MLNPADRQTLLTQARKSIEHGLSHGRPLAVNSKLFAATLQQTASSFVTITSRGASGNDELRGCIGSLVASRPLVVDVVEHAYAAAFKDPRFPPLDHEDYSSIHLEISVLSPEQELPATCETELLEQLIVGKDGVTIRDGAHQATFLPSVWRQLPDKAEFILHLKRKAGLPDDYWSSETLKFFRYQTESFAE